MPAQESSPGRRALVSLLVALALAGGAYQSAPAAEPAPTRLYVAVDRSQIIDVQEPTTKVSVANPSVADVHVLTPNRVLVSGRTVGATSLLVLSGKSAQHFDLVVHPAPVGAALLPEPTRDPHPVLVHRGDRVTEHLFVRDRDQQWVEFGNVKPETDTGKK